MHLDLALQKNKKLQRFKNKIHSETKSLNQCIKEINFQLTLTRAQMFNYTIKLQLRSKQLNKNKLFLDIKNQKIIASNKLNLNLKRVISFRADWVNHHQWAQVGLVIHSEEKIEDHHLVEFKLLRKLLQNNSWVNYSKWNQDQQSPSRLKRN